MTISSVVSRMDYTGNGSADTFAYTFKVFSEGDLTVTVKETATGVETSLVLSTDYTVTGVGATSGGNVVLVNSSQAWLDGDGDLATGYTMTIRRVVDLTQETDIRNQGAYYPEIHEDQFDKLTMTDQQQQDEIDRSIKLPETSVGVDTALPAPSAGLAIGWNVTEDGLTNIASAGSLSVTAYAETLLDDNNAGEARTTLDVSQAINSLTAETAPAVGDLIAVRDVSVPADRKMTLENALKVVNSLTEDTAPQSADFLLSYDASAAAVKKVAFSRVGGGVTGIEALQQKNQAGKFGIKTRIFDNAVENDGGSAPLSSYFTAYLIENYTSGGASIKPVWNPVVIFDSDKNYDSITGWSAVSAATTLAATAGSTKVGANHFSFNKDGSAVDASIRHTLAAQTLSVGANYRVWFWVDMPSVTGLSNIYLRIMGAATTDFSRWNLTTDYAGNAITTGYNSFFVDIKNQAAATTGGTAWTYTQLARYVDIGVTTSSAGQTYTGIKFAGLWFSAGDIADFYPLGHQFTGFNNSTKHDFKLDAANTRHDGVVTLDSSVAANYVSGISNADATRLERSTVSWTNNGAIGFDSASTKTSGSISTEQDVRLSFPLKESSTGDVKGYVDLTTAQIYKVTVVGGSTIGVEDPSDTSANLVNGNSLLMFETINSVGARGYSHRATRTITGSSHSSGTTTITVDPTGIVVGDIVVKQHLEVAASVVGKTSDESFTTMSYDTQGVQLIDQGLAIPNPGNLYGSWALADYSETLALRDRSGNGRNLVKVGSPNLADSFQRGRYAYGSATNGNYLRAAAGTATELAAHDNTLVQLSMWVYYNGTSGADRALAAAYSNIGATDRGWVLRNPNSGGAVRLVGFGTSAPNVTTSNTMSVGWNHVSMAIQESNYLQIWLNGVLTSSASIADYYDTQSAQAFYIGVTTTSFESGQLEGAVGMRLADLHVWRGGAVLTTAQIQSLYNAGAPVPTGFFPVVRNEYSLTGQSGQKLSMRARMSRSTTAVNPQILDLGALKTS